MTVDMVVFLSEPEAGRPRALDFGMRNADFGMHLIQVFKTPIHEIWRLALTHWSKYYATASLLKYRQVAVTQLVPGVCTGYENDKRERQGEPWSAVSEP